MAAEHRSGDHDDFGQSNCALCPSDEQINARRAELVWKNAADLVTAHETGVHRWHRRRPCPRCTRPPWRGVLAAALLTVLFAAIGHQVASSLRGHLQRGDRVGATCGDGGSSRATGSGACSWHGGVAQWAYGGGAERPRWSEPLLVGPGGGGGVVIGWWVLTWFKRNMNDA